MFATIYGEGSGNVEFIHGGKDVKNIKIVSVDATNKKTGEIHTFDEAEMTIEEFYNTYSQGEYKTYITLSRQDDRTGEEKIIGRVDKNTFENSVIQSQKIQGTQNDEKDAR